MSFGEFFNATAGIGDAYSAGTERFKQRNALAKLGQQLQGGDYGGAAQTAFAAGDVGTGVSLLKLGEERRKTGLEEAAGQWFQSRLSGGAGGVSMPGASAEQSSGLSNLGTPSRSLPSFADTSGPAGGYLAGLETRESSGNPLARSRTSSATGLHQFTDKTWAGVMREHPELGLTADGRTDPAQSRRAVAAFTTDNEQVLQRAGLPVNDASRYASHFLGRSGGPRFVAGTLSNPDAPALTYANPDQVRANRNVFFNRDGSPKTAGQVMADFGRSFGGVQRPAGGSPRPGVAVANNEAETQALEARMGMTPQGPQQVASYDPRADLPTEGTVPMGYSIPEGQGAVGEQQSSGVRGLIPSSSSAVLSGEAARRANPTFGVPSGGRTMSLPPEAGGPPVQVAQAGGGAPQAATDAGGQNVGGFPASRIAQSPLGQKIPFLMQAVAHPNLPAGQRQLAQTLLKEALDEAKLPDSVKEFQYARANGWTQARTPAEYAREAKGPQIVAPGSSGYSADGQLLYTAPDRNRSNVADEVDARRQAAASLGLRESTPQFQSYVLTGKMPREDQQPHTASDKKAILEADESVASAESVIGNLKAAKDLSAKAYAGPLAGARGTVAAQFGGERGEATLELDNLVTTNALGQLKAIFGAAPTEGERKILLDIQGSSNLPHPLRVKIYDRGIALAERRLQINRDRATDMRGQTYFRPDGGPQGSRGASPAGGAPALPAPAPSNRPGAASAGDRFGALVGSGMSREQAFEQMQQEGY